METSNFKAKLEKLQEEPFRLRNLRGAVCEYLDEGSKEEFMKDLKEILEYEVKYFRDHKEMYEDILNTIFSSKGKTKNKD